MSTNKQTVKVNSELDKVLEGRSLKQREHAEFYILYNENKKTKPPTVMSESRKQLTS